MLLFLNILLTAFLLYSNKEARKEDIFIKPFLIFSTLLVIVTEFFSLFKILNFWSVISFWSIFSIIVIYLLFKKDFFSKKNLLDYKSNFLIFFQRNSVPQNLLLSTLFVFSFTILLQGLLYPPNNWDSLTYHLSRIMYWIGNESVDHFPTHILRHLYQPPFGEYFILHVNLIQGNDILANSVQWLFLMYCILAVNAILRLLNVEKTNRLITLLLIITIPSLALQASTTKNDIICSFFVLTTILYSIKIFKANQKYDYLFLGLSVGLGMLTKGTFYLFAFPILLLLFLSIIKKGISIQIIIKSSFAILIAIILNAGHFTRNYSVNKNILNIDKAEGKMYSNNKMNAKLLASNILKNSGLHLGYPIDTLGDKVIRKIHKDFLKTPINNSDTNYLDIPYDGKTVITTHEDLVPNTLHFIILIFSLVLVITISMFNFDKKIVIFTSLILMQFLLFCAYLKWQPWHTRLHIPLFITAFILVGLLIEKFKWYRLLLILLLPVCAYSFYFNVTYNNIRPFKEDLRYTKDININDNRYKKYFSNQLFLYDDYKKIIQLIDSEDVKTIGFSLPDWEYPLLKNFYQEKKKIYSINVNNISSVIPQKISNLDCVISNKKVEFIIFNNKKLYNKTPNNNYIWCYQ